MTEMLKFTDRQIDVNSLLLFTMLKKFIFKKIKASNINLIDFIF